MIVSLMICELQLKLWKQKKQQYRQMNIFELPHHLQQPNIQENTLQDVKTYLEALFARVTAIIPRQQLDHDLIHYSIRIIEAHDSESEIDPCEAQHANNPEPFQAFEAKEEMKSKSSEDGLQHSCQQSILADDLDDRKSDNSVEINYQVRVIEVHDSESQSERYYQQEVTIDKEADMTKIENKVAQEPEAAKIEIFNQNNGQIQSKEKNNDGGTCEINVVKANEPESQAFCEQESASNQPELEQKIHEKVNELHQSSEDDNYSEDLPAEIKNKQKDKPKNLKQDQMYVEPKEQSNIVRFKRSHKAFKSQLNRRQMFNDQNFDTNIHSSRNRHVIDSSRSMALPSFKPKGGYNQLKDKLLVQYFYPRQNKIIKKEVQTQQQPSSQPQYQPQKIFKKCRSQKKYNFSKLYNRNCQKGYSTIQQCGRKSEFTDYDLISCKSSLSHLKSYQNLFCQAVQPQNSQFDTTRFSQATVLRHRIANLQSRVCQKVPYLIKMGVNFRKLTKR